jgi:hypothetical protein
MAASEMEAVPNGGVPKWGPDEKLIIDKQKLNPDLAVHCSFDN